MILNTDKPDVIHGGEPIRRINMNEMSAEAIAVMIENSRDGFYSNKILAPIREYSTNARDSHIQSGIPTRPIQVTLPTILEPELKIRDFGSGLNMEQLTDVYFKYWTSTKRGSNEQNGCLGIGAKSAFAYAPVYTVTSWANGMKTVATGQKNGFADIIFHEKNVDNEEQGVEVIIPIQSKDIEQFIREALEFYKYWDIRPTIYGVDDERLKVAFATCDLKPFLSGEGWAVRPAGYGKGETKAVMSYVPYAIDWNQVKNGINPGLLQRINAIFDFLQENITTMYFANGSLAFTPNRESLQYNDITIAALSDKLSSIYDSLLELITSKIKDAPNIWEAKICYNRLFRREIDGFDKTFSYGGDLQVLQRIVNNGIRWNGIPINSGMFTELEDWCANEGKLTCNYRDGSFQEILTTYVKNDDKTSVVSATKKQRGRRQRWNLPERSMVCSPKYAVVIQDTDKESLAKGYAAWLIYKSGKDINAVYVLNLKNAEVKDEFYKHYHFDTVPVTYVSTNETMVKEYLKSIRPPRQKNTSSEGRKLNCPYIEIANRRSSTYVTGAYWATEDVNAKGIEGGGYYVVYNKDSFKFKNNEIHNNSSGEFWQSIYELALMAGVNLPKVYGIHPKFANSVWFKEAVEEGNWINLSEFVDENADVIPKDVIKRIVAFEHGETSNRFGTHIAGELFPLLTNPDGTIGQYFNELLELKKHWNIRDMAINLYLDGFCSDEVEIKRFADMNSANRKKYPLLFKTNDAILMSRCDEPPRVTNFNTVRELADYINLMDVYGV